MRWPAVCASPRHSSTAVPDVFEASPQWACTSSWHWLETPYFSCQSWLFASKSAVMACLQPLAKDSWYMWSWRQLSFSPQTRPGQNLSAVYLQTCPVFGLRTNASISTLLCRISAARHSFPRSWKWLRRHVCWSPGATSLQRSRSSAWQPERICGARSARWAWIRTTREISLWHSGLRLLRFFSRHWMTGPTSLSGPMALPIGSLSTFSFSAEQCS
mmetsp:Transcript_50250/g.140264  ORF Transcript_50250/g.140264 Transcript_50250/m.140264 type:complete len:216 (+) Transcript_50250:173-820(+)